MRETDNKHAVWSQIGRWHGHWICYVNMLHFSNSCYVFPGSHTLGISHCRNFQNTLWPIKDDTLSVCHQHFQECWRWFAAILRYLIYHLPKMMLLLYILIINTSLTFKVEEAYWRLILRLPQIPEHSLMWLHLDRTHNTSLIGSHLGFWSCQITRF